MGATFRHKPGDDLESKVGEISTKDQSHQSENATKCKVIMHHLLAPHASEDLVVLVSSPILLPGLPFISI